MLIGAIDATPPQTLLGVSFHARHEDFKGASWRDVAGDVLERAVAIERRTGRHVVAFDVGGGWEPEEFDASFEPDMRWLVDRIVSPLPFCTRLLFEPGQALCTPIEALLTEVLEVRGRRDAVVDVGYSDWPEMQSYAHGFYVWRRDRWEPVGSVPDRLLGRTCLEYPSSRGCAFPTTSLRATGCSSPTRLVRSLDGVQLRPRRGSTARSATDQSRTPLAQWSERAACGVSLAAKQGISRFRCPPPSPRRRMCCLSGALPSSRTTSCPRTSTRW